MKCYKKKLKGYKMPVYCAQIGFESLLKCSADLADLTLTGSLSLKQ